MNIRLWNCRGTALEIFVLSMVDLLRIHDPCIVILVEPKVSNNTAWVCLERPKLNQMIVYKAHHLKKKKACKKGFMVLILIWRRHTIELIGKSLKRF